MRHSIVGLCIVAAAAYPVAAYAQDARTPAPAVSIAAKAIETAAAAEIADKAIPSVAIALVDKTGVIWSAAWGHIDQAGTQPATAATLYRADSLTDIFASAAMMKLAEQGKVDLDAPVTRYLPDFRPHNPFGVPVTLRHLLAHRSGLVRSVPTEGDIVAGVNATTLVAKPGTATKYSEAGSAVVRAVVARVTGSSFEASLQKLVLAPLGMNATGFANKAGGAPLAFAQMASFDGGRWGPPAISGDFHTTVGDLGAFVTSMLNAGSNPKNKAGASAMPPGFEPDALDGRRMVGRGGTFYGHVADIRFLSDAGIGVAVFSTVDAGPTAERLGAFALRSLLAARKGETPATWLRTQPIAAEKIALNSGRFVHGDDSVHLRAFDGALVLDGPEVAAEVRQANGRHYLDDAQYFSDAIALADDASWVELAGKRYTRAEWSRPPAPGAEMAQQIGEYGPEQDLLRIYQRDGKAYARAGWTHWLPLRPLGHDSYAFPENRGPYALEKLTFERDGAGKVTAAVLGPIRLPKRDVGAEAEAKVRSVTNVGIDGLRSAARAATPPPEAPPLKKADMVALTAIEPSIRLDVRYATTNNFMGQKIYERSGAFLQRPAAEAIGRIHNRLAAQGFGLLIHDAYRPWHVTKMFWDATPPANRVFVADPSQGSRHNRGAAVDLTLFDLKSGQPIVTTGRYDEFSSRSFSNYVGGSDEQRWLREVLRDAMERDGFTVYAQEWWHFDRNGWQDYPIGNRSFDELEPPGR